MHVSICRQSTNGIAGHGNDDNTYRWQTQQTKRRRRLDPLQKESGSLVALIEMTRSQYETTYANTTCERRDLALAIRNDVGCQRCAPTHCDLVTSCGEVVRWRVHPYDTSHTAIPFFSSRPKGTSGDVRKSGGGERVERLYLNFFCYV